MAQTLPTVPIPRTKRAREQFWLDHPRALHEQDQPLSAYAEAHGLSPGSLYRARARLRGRRLVSAPELTAPAFVPACIAPPGTGCRVHLPNGVVVEVPEHTERAMCATVLECASALP